MTFNNSKYYTHALFGHVIVNQYHTVLCPSCMMSGLEKLSQYFFTSYRTLVWTNIAVSKIYGVCFLLALIECQMYAVDVI